MFGFSRINANPRLVLSTDICTFSDRMIEINNPCDDVNKFSDEELDQYRDMTYYPMGICWLVVAKTNKLPATEYKCANGQFNFSVAVVECADGYRVGDTPFYITKRAFKTEASALSWYNKCKHNGKLTFKLGRKV